MRLVTEAEAESKLTIRFFWMRFDQEHNQQYNYQQNDKNGSLQ